MTLVDVRYLVRTLRRSPWYSLGVIGITATTFALTATAFAIVDGVLFKPLPYAQASELYVALGGVEDQELPPSFKDVDDWSTALPEAAFGTFQITTVTLGTIDENEGSRITAATIDASFLDVLGVRPIIGGFGPSDFAGGSRSALISHALWQRRYGARQDVVGQRLGSDPVSPAFRVAGVLPPGFVFPDTREAPDALLPRTVDPAGEQDRHRRGVNVIVRLPAGRATPELRTRLDAAARATTRDYVQTGQDLVGGFDHVVLKPLGDQLSVRHRDAFLIAFSAAALVVVLACVNIAGLVRAKWRELEPEIAVRQALGARRRDVLRSLSLEVLTLVTVGALLGGGLGSRLLLNTVVHLLPDGIRLLKEPAIDGRVIFFVFLAVLFSATSIVLLTGRTAATRTFVGEIGAVARSIRSPVRATSLLVASQLALTLVLTLGGSLFVASVMRVWVEDPGFDAGGLAQIDVRVGDPTIPPAVIRDRVMQLLNLVLNRQGVESAAVYGGPFLKGAQLGSPFRLPVGAQVTGLTEIVSISEQFFLLARITPTAGRLPTTGEFGVDSRVVVVSERVAREYWPGRSPLGQALDGRLGSFVVVGVVPGARFQSRDRSSPGEIYVPFNASGQHSSVTILVRSSWPATEVGALSRFIGLSMPTVQVLRTTTVMGSMAETIRPRRLNAWLFGGFAAAALLQAAVGIFGLLSMTSASRTREIGVRLALGDTPAGIIGLLLREAMPTVIWGVAVGGCIGFWAVRLIRVFLYQTPIYDARVWSVCILLVPVTAFIAAAAPAIRAARLDPVRALRFD